MANKNDRELQLIRRAKRGDRVAAGDLLEMHKGFINIFAKRYARYRVESIEDYEQVSRIALLESIKNYDPGCGIKFLTYAGKLMKWRLGRESQVDYVVRPPMQWWVEGSSEENQERSRAARNTTSLDAPRGVDKNGSIASWIPDKSPGIVEASGENEELGLLRRAIERLEPRLQTIIKRRMAGEKLHEVGLVLGLTKERVRQLESRAERYLKDIIGRLAKEKIQTNTIAEVFRELPLVDTPTPEPRALPDRVCKKCGVVFTPGGLRRV